MKTIFQVQATINKISTMSQWLRLMVDTQELIDPDKLSILMGLYNKTGWFTFSSHQIDPDDIIDLPPVKIDSKKTPAERLRNVLFRMWEQDNMNYTDFNLYYQYYMDKLIERLTEKLT